MSNGKRLKAFRVLEDFSKFCFRRMFEICQNFGINILPRHYYSEIPFIRELEEDEYWKKPHSMTGVNGVDIKNQLDFVKECCTQGLIDRHKRKDIYDYCCKQNDEQGYGPIEADFLFSFISTKRPKRIVQVGCGVSTSVILLSAEESDYLPEITCVEPYPTRFLRNSNKIRLIPKKMQLVDMDTLIDLDDNDLLFVDSTHTVKPGSEVNKLILEVMPRLKKGVWVHFHDIYFPYDYSRYILTRELFFSCETALLHSFLVNNVKYALKVSLGMLHYAVPLELKRFLPNYCPAKNDYGLAVSEGHFPSSVYLEVIK